MKCIILAAGKGTRIPEISENMPKAMAPVKTMTIVERQIKFLLKNNIRDISIVVGYKSDKIKEHVRGIYPEINIIENTEYENTNNMFSLNLTESKVANSDFIILNGDVVFEECLLSHLIENKGLSIIPYDSSNYDEEELKLKIKDEKAYSIMPKKTGPENSNGSTIGMFSLNKSDGNLLFEDIKNVLNEGKRNEWFEYSLDRVFKKTEMLPIDVAGTKWIEIDTTEDLEKARRFFNS